MTPHFAAYVRAEQIALAGDGFTRLKCPECGAETRSKSLRVKCPVKHKPHRMMLALPPIRREASNGESEKD
jgi:hypothetical protein